jgi:transcriptional regulator with XRE-family HTH domain
MHDDGSGATTAHGFGPQLRHWRELRRLSQQALALAAGVSARHLSYLETGRSRPSRTMVATLAEQLQVPLRARNQLLVAAGHAPQYPQRSLDAPELGAVRRAVDRILARHDPLPAVAVDRRWDLVAANRAVGALVTPDELAAAGSPPNVYRLVLHPDALAPRIVNLTEVAHHLVVRLRREAEATGDGELAVLLDEVTRYPAVRRGGPVAAGVPSEVVVPLRLRHPRGELAMFAAVTTFGTPADVTVAELALELFYPLDEATAARLTELAAATDPAVLTSGRIHWNR